MKIPISHRSSFWYASVFATLAFASMVFVRCLPMVTGEPPDGEGFSWLSAITVGLLGFVFGLAVGIARKEPCIAFYLMAAVGLLFSAL